MGRLSVSAVHHTTQHSATMTAAAAAAPKAKKAAKPKAPAAHPPYAAMIKAAVKALADKKGSSRQAILKYICANYKVDAAKAASRVRLALKKMIASKALVAAAAAGKKGAGSFKSMDFVDCKCKFGLNDVITPWQSVNTVVEFPFLEAEEGHITSDHDVKTNPEPVLHPGGSESINLGLVQGLGALSQHGEPSVDLLDQEHPEKYQNSDVLLLQKVIGGPPLFYSDTRKLRKEDGF